ncbi:UNVERIFIED_CONTAM: hypothetical protein NCL1_20227 [Trichonephila clavipes]
MGIYQTYSTLRWKINLLKSTAACPGTFQQLIRFSSQLYTQDEYLKAPKIHEAMHTAENS